MFDHQRNLVIAVMSEDRVIRLSEVAEHKVTKGKDKSVWFAIHDAVYDVTKFLDEVRFLRLEFLRVCAKITLRRQAR